MLIGAMLITLLTLMNHPLFEWSLRPKLTSLNNNKARKTPEDEDDQDVEEEENEAVEDNEEEF